MGFSGGLARVPVGCGQRPYPTYDTRQVLVGRISAAHPMRCPHNSTMGDTSMSDAAKGLIRPTVPGKWLQVGMFVLRLIPGWGWGLQD